MNVDLAVGYVTSTFNHFGGTVAIAGVGNFNGPVTPFIGAGPGIAGSTAKVETFGLGSTTLPVNATSSETDFAFDAIVGVDYALSSHW